MYKYLILVLLIPGCLQHDNFFENHSIAMSTNGSDLEKALNSYKELLVTSGQYSHENINCNLVDFEINNIDLHDDKISLNLENMKSIRIEGFFVIGNGSSHIDKTLEPLGFTAINVDKTFQGARIHPTLKYHNKTIVCEKYVNIK